MDNFKKLWYVAFLSGFCHLTGLVCKQTVACLLRGMTSSILIYLILVLILVRLCIITLINVNHLSPRLRQEGIGEIGYSNYLYSSFGSLIGGLLMMSMAVQLIVESIVKNYGSAGEKNIIFKGRIRTLLYNCPHPSNEYDSKVFWDHMWRTYRIKASMPWKAALPYDFPRTHVLIELYEQDNNFIKMQFRNLSKAPKEKSGFCDSVCETTSTIARVYASENIDL